MTRYGLAKMKESVLMLASVSAVGAHLLWEVLHVKNQWLQQGTHRANIWVGAVCCV